MKTHTFTTPEAEFEMLGDGSKNFAGFLLTIARDFSIGDRIIFECGGAQTTRHVTGIFYPGTEAIRNQDSGIAPGWAIVEFLQVSFAAQNIELVKNMFSAEAKATIAFSQYLESEHPDDLQTWLDFDLGRARASEAARKAILGGGK